MSNQSFKVKNSLHLTPQAAEPSALEVGDLWMDIDGNLKRWDGSASQDVGAGGVGSVDIMFAQTLEQAVIGDFTTTGTVAITEDVLDVLQGDKSLEITHTGGASAEQIVEVPVKFRGKNVTLSLDVSSTAQSGNLTLTVTDQTNIATLINAEAIQPQEAGQSSVKRSVSFNIPSDCESLKYRFNAVSEAAVTSIIDNVVIELTETARLSTTIEVPVITEWQSYVPTTQGLGAISNVDMKWRQVGESIEIQGKFTTGTVTAEQARVSLPEGYLSDSPNSVYSIGRVIRFAGGSAYEKDISLLTQGGFNYFGLGVTGDSGTSDPQVLLNGNLIIGSGNSVTLNAKVKIQGLTATETQSVSLAQTVLVQESDSYLLVSGNAGQAITVGVTDISFANILTSKGDAFSFNGSQVTAMKSGQFSLSATAAFTSGIITRLAVYKNGVFLSSSSLMPSSSVHSYTLTLDLAEGDIVSFRTVDIGATLSNSTAHTLQVSYQGSLKQLNVSENQKIAIPTSELRMEGASTRGTGSDSAIVRFDNIAKLRGDAFTVESTAALGTVITMKKAGKLDINSTISVNGGTAAITLNQSTRTNLPIVSGEVISSSGDSAVVIQCMSGAISVVSGDKIRVSQNVTPSSSIFTSLNLSFQEQQVSVSVTNVLPQFSESDSSVRVDTANGYGSTASNKIRRFSNVRDNLGSAITYADSATNGASFTVNESGTYQVSYNENHTSANTFGISVNGDPVIAIRNLPATQRLGDSTTPGSNGFGENVAWSGYLQKDDIIRPHCDVTIAAVANAAVSFTISKVGKPNVTGVDVTPFAKIEYEVKQHYSAALNSSFDILTVRRDTNEGLFAISDSGVNTIVITALRDMEISASAYDYLSGSVAYTLLTATNHSGQIIARGIGPWEAGSGIGGGHLSVTTEVLKNQTLTITKSATAGSFTDAAIEITATELRDAYQVIGGGIENTYSARITSAGAITSQSYPFIESVTKGVAGNYTLNLVSGFFTEAFSAVITPDNSTGNAYGRVTTTTSTASVLMINTSASAADAAFSITVTRQGDDYRTPSKAIGLPAQRIAVLNHELAPTVGSGTSTTGAWITQNLTNIKSDTTGLVKSLAANTITLPAGRYKVNARQVFYGTGDSLIRIYNNTDSSTLLVGSGVFANTTPSDFVLSVVDGVINLLSEKQIAIQYRVQSAGTTFSRGGISQNYGENVENTSITFEKIEE